jgi:hypothetical protein
VARGSDDRLSGEESASKSARDRGEGRASDQVGWTLGARHAVSYVSRRTFALGTVMDPPLSWLSSAIVAGWSDRRARSECGTRRFRKQESEKATQRVGLSVKHLIHVFSSLSIRFSTWLRT